MAVLPFPGRACPMPAPLCGPLRAHADLGFDDTLRLAQAQAQAPSPAPAPVGSLLIVPAVYALPRRGEKRI